MIGLFLAAALFPAGAPPVWDESFGRNPLWNDGNAEVSFYDAVDVKYGSPRTSRAVLIVVAEDMNRTELVKADHPEGEPRTLRVLKLNHLRSIPTGVYTYQQMLSLFLSAERLAPVKLTVTSHEWCGNSSVEWRSDRSRLSLRSYFETVGDRDLPLPIGDALFYDELPLKLRALDFSRTREARVSVVDTLFSNAPAPPRVRDATLRVSRGESGSTRVELQRDSGKDVFEFDAAFPHRLRRWDRADGGRLTLVDSRRFRYWEKNHPGDESLLPSPAAR